MIAHSGLKPRTFARRFLAATGSSGGLCARGSHRGGEQRLETDTVSVEEIDYIVGYEDPTFFRRLFKRKIGLTLAAYRRKSSKIATIGHSGTQYSIPAPRRRNFG
jgi:transcriptional regulator GlxA family with amidase domain